MRKRGTGAVGQRLQEPLNVLIPPRTKIENELAGSCSSRHWETSSSEHSFIAFTTAYSLRAVPGNSGGAVDPATCTPDIYVRSLVSRGFNSGVRYSARLASADSSGQRVPGSNLTPSISANGRFVCFSNLNGGTPSGIFRKDLWTGTLTTVVPGAAGICSTANDGKVAVDYRSAIGQTVEFFEISENGNVTEIYRETAVPFGNTPALGERALNPSGSEGMFLRSNVAQGNAMRLHFTSASGSPTSVSEVTIQNYVRNAADRPAYSTGDNHAVWLASNPNWNSTTEIVETGLTSVEAGILGEANGYWRPKLAPRGGGRFWIYRGLDEAVGYPEPQNHGTDAIYLLRGQDVEWSCDLLLDLGCTMETREPTFETGNENACRVSTDKYGRYAGDGKTEGNTISGDGAFVGFASDKSVLDATGTNDDAPMYPSAYVYVRFTDMYEECRRFEGSEDVKLANTYRPLMYYDIRENFFSSNLEMWQTGKFGLEPTQVKRCETGLRTFMPFGTKCPFALQGPEVSIIDSNMEDINLLPTGDDQMFLDSPGEGGNVIRHASDYLSLLANDHIGDAMYYRSVPVPETGGKIIQYWLPSYYSYNNQGRAESGNELDGYHEGEWEMVQIEFNSKESPLTLAYAQHHGGERRRWQDQVRNGLIVESSAPGDSKTHPVVFPARGSHASYFESGVHAPLPWDAVPVASDFHRACGEYSGYWTTGICRTPTPFARAIPGNDDSGWPFYTGRWGEVVGEPNLNQGGAGSPSQQGEKWSAPRTWQYSGAVKDGTFSNAPIKQSQIVHSPVESRFVASDGKQFGIDDDVEIREIDGAQIVNSVSDDVQRISLPEQYDSTAGGIWHFNGTGNGTWTQEWVLPDPESGITRLATYSNIDVTTDLRAKLEVADDSVPTMQIDRDGDGVFEEGKSPDSVDAIPIDNVDPSEVDSLEARPAGERSVALDWNSVEDDAGSAGDYAVGYRVIYGDREFSAGDSDVAGLNSRTTRAVEGSRQTVQIDDLPTDVEHWFRVEAIDDVGRESGRSMSASATPSAATADLAVSVSADTETVDAGNEAAFTVAVQNHGSLSEPEPRVRLRSQPLFGKTTVSGSFGECEHESTGDVVCPVAELEPGASVELIVTGTAGISTSHSMSAEVNGSRADSDSGNNSSQASVQVRPVANLSVRKNPEESTLTEGDSISLTIAVTNSGPSVAYDVELIDPMATGLELESVIAPGGICADSATVECKFNRIEVGATVLVAIEAHAVGDGMSASTASVTSSIFDSDQSDNASVSSVNVRRSADLGVSTTVNDGYRFGRVLASVAISNAGPSGAKNPVVNITPPSEFVVVSAVASNGSCVVAPVISCSLNDLDTSRSADMKLEFRSYEAGSFELQASVNSTTPDTTTVNNIDVDGFLVRPATCRIVPTWSVCARPHSVWILLP